VDLIYLTGATVTGYKDLADLKKVWHLPLGVSGKRPFQLLERIIRRLQSALRLPYLALFDSFRFYEACLRTLPGYDICHEYAGLLSVGAAYACRRLGLPYVLTVDADLLLEADVMGQPIKGIRRIVARWSAKTTYRLADKIICVSAPARRNLIDNWGVHPDKITVIPNGVNVDLFGCKTDTAVTKAEYGIGRGPVIMFVGGFQRWHGLDNLLDAFVQVRIHIPEAQLVLVGDGPDRAFVAQRIRELGLDEKAIITGFVPHTAVPPLLAVADVVTIPYPQLPEEMWFSPLKLYEYMAAGKAIVASRAGQIEAVIQDGETGKLVTPGDVNALAQAMIDLLQNPTVRQQLGHRARQEAVAYHTWERQIGKLESVYASLKGTTTRQQPG
jgi:starch synthase